MENVKVVERQGHQGDVHFRKLKIENGRVFVPFFKFKEGQEPEATWHDIGPESVLSSLESTITKAPKEKDGKITLLKGEAATHHHQLPANFKGDVYALPSEGIGGLSLMTEAHKVVQNFLVHVKEDTQLQHNDVATGKKAEHDSICFKPGWYHVNGQMQYDSVNKRMTIAAD